VTVLHEDGTRYRIGVRLWLLLSLAMAVASMAGMFALLYFQRPFVASLGGFDADAQRVLFASAGISIVVAALVGLAFGSVLSRRIWAIVERTDAAVASISEAPRKLVKDELGALDAAVGRLTLSLDRFVTDSDILARLPEGMLLVDGGADLLLSFNTAAETLLGPGLDRFRGLPLFEADGALPLARGNRSLADLLAEARRTGGVTRAEEIPAVTHEGKAVLLEGTVQSRPGREQDATFVLLLQDASEKRRIREQIKRTDQLALLGGMAARVAHEVRTPLATVRGLVELLQADLAVHDRRRDYTERILAALERQDQLVQKLLTLTHAEPEAWQPVYLRELLHELIAAWPEGQEPMLAVDGRLSVVHGDPVLLNEVFTNLVRNAFEASIDGEVIVRMSATTNAARVTVTNRGNGVPPELQERIFQPFFTTKPRGTGLGLAIARQVVEAHRGTIRVESDGRTTTHFVVELPASRAFEPAVIHA